MMNKLPTQKGLLEEHRAKLDERFHIKYPNGKFSLQCRGAKGDIYHGIPYWLMHWVPRRPTSHVRYRGISVGMNKEIKHDNYQNCSFGRCNDYDTLEKLLAACERREVPKELVEAFKTRYQNKYTQGFK